MEPPILFLSLFDQDGVFIMSTRIELDPGASIGCHRHEGTEEVYFIMSGEGLYTEEGEDSRALPGTCFCAEREISRDSEHGQ